MSLSSDLISQFAKITNDGKEREAKEVTLYGEIVQFEDMLCVKFDGSNEMTPAVTTSTIKVGDRVSAIIKNHTAIITGNFSDPSASSDELHGIKTTTSSIELLVQGMGIRIDNLGVQIQGLTTFSSEIIEDMNGVTTKFDELRSGLSTGTTVIDGACIKTGLIEAEHLNLTGAITFEDLSQPVQKEFENLEKEVEDANTTASNAMSWASTAVDIAASITIPGYITTSGITKTKIESPEIIGNNISVYGTFQTIGNVNGSNTPTGYMGAASGMDDNGNTTFGVALSNTWNANSFAVGTNHVIVTNAGVRLQSNSGKVSIDSTGMRMQFGTNSVVIRSNGIYLYTPNGNKAYYNDVEIGSGGGSSVIAVWG